MLSTDVEHQHRAIRSSTLGRLRSYQGIIMSKKPDTLALYEKLLATQPDEEDDWTLMSSSVQSATLRAS
jgi:hypothetical protein